MAGLTKEQRELREKAKSEELKAKIKAELEDEIRAEYEKKMELTIENKSDCKKVEDKKDTMKRMQKFTRIPLDTIVPVVCNTHGGATYISKKIVGYTVEWDDFGSVEYMELGELASLRNTDKRFFEDNWIVLEDTEEYTALQLYDFLKVSKYYQNIFTPENIDEIFTYSKDKIVKVISTLSKGMKETIAVSAKRKLDAGTLDRNIVDTLESVLNVQFTI